MDLKGARYCYLSLVLAFLLSYITPTSVLATDEEKGESKTTSFLELREKYSLTCKRVGRQPAQADYT